jgi:CIC family chloride channel protein
MLRNDIGRLPVVSRADEHHMIGYLSRASVMSAWGRHLEHESVREHGWLTRHRKGHAHPVPGKRA